MKPVFPESYWLENWDRYIDPASTPYLTKSETSHHYLNLEGTLKRTMESYKGTGIPEKALPVIEAMEAKKLADKAKELVMEELKIQKSIDAGTSSFGMMTQSQESAIRCEFRWRFEFNCFQLKLFKQNHNL